MLIVGAGGQVGGRLVDRCLAQGHEVTGTYITRVPRQRVGASYPLDKTKRDQVTEMLGKVKPDVVFDTGALHNVDYCELHPDEAMAVNRDGTSNIAEACGRLGAKFVFVSTDYVFDGLAGPYREGDVAKPVNAYGESKLQGEKAALEGCANAVVVRPSVIYSWVAPDSAGASSSGKPLNFGSWLAQQLKAGKQLSIVDDQIGSPTLADDLASAMLSLATSDVTGVFHTAGATVLSRYDFSLKMADALGFERSLIRPVQSSQFKQIARRPPNSGLLSEKVKAATGYQMMEIGRAVGVFAAQMRGEAT